jgi:hypothetical protein
VPLAMRRPLSIFGWAIFIAVFVAVVADAASRGNVIVLAVAWLAAIIMFVVGVLVRLRRSRGIVRAALERAGYDVLEMNYRYLRFGPFFSLWNTSRAQDVYRVLVRHRVSGSEETVWARWGRSWITAPQKLEFRCQNDATAARLKAEAARREPVEQPREHRSTGLAVALTFVLLVPGEIGGHIVAILYRWAIAHLIDESLLDHSTGGWASVFLLDGFSGIVQGTVAGAIAAYVSARIVKRADYLVVAYANAAIVIGFSTLALAIAILEDGLSGLDIQHLGPTANALGLVSALFLAAHGIGMRQDKSPAPTPAPG